MKIELLYFAECPHHRPTRDLIDATLSDLGLDAEVAETDIRDQHEAERHRFLGSPSIRVDGADIEVDARQRTAFALGCRLYGASGVPPKAMLLEALRGMA